MRDHDKETELILQIRNLAGQIGEINHSEQVGKSDAEDYDFKVLTGLANATVEVIDFDPGKLLHWVGYCLIGLGADIDPRVQSLMDALVNEVMNQLENQDDEENNEA
jgi:hypothetical protein